MNERTPRMDESPIEARLAAPPSVTGGAEPREPILKTGASIIQSKGTVLAVLFLVTGALGIPLLWMNPNFSTVERIFWSVITCLYTAVFITIVGAILMWCYRIITGY